MATIPRFDLPSTILPIGGTGFPDRLMRRSLVWQVYLQSLYGPPSGRALGDDLIELPLPEGVATLTRDQLASRPHVLRRLLEPLALRLDADRWTADLRELALLAVRELRPQPGFVHALARLRASAAVRFAVERGREDIACRRALRFLDPEELLRVEPSVIESDLGGFRVSRRALVKAPVEELKDVIDPLNWTRMGEFFNHVGPVGPRSVRSDGWSGLFEERFDIGWGPWRVCSANPTLRVDFTISRTRVRADYALMFEADDQLEFDDGFLELRNHPGRVGWTEYVAVKTTRFRSPYLNLLTPTVAAVFLESSLASLEDKVYEHQGTSISRESS